MPDLSKRTSVKRKQGKGFSLVLMLMISLLILSGNHRVKAVQPPEMLRGKIISLKDSTAIPNVHVINQSNSRAGVSGRDGQFLIPAHAGDSIRFQAIGFETKVIEAGQDLLDKEEDWVVGLEEKIYELPVVEVFPYQTFSEFKYAFLNFKDPGPEFELELPEVSLDAIPGNRPPGFGVAIPGPITFLYDRFSRRGKAQRNYLEVMRQEELASRAARVVNPQVIERLTSLKEREDINAFLIYCGITDEYVVSTREAEVYARIIGCYETYAETIEKR
ncbi:MAG: hypothetical protein V2I46_06030 [Bacteroides sp.]|jgi:hypothetical protein|nr:hypothetical protein [Bacteroides sp.]